MGQKKIHWIIGFAVLMISVFCLQTGLADTVASGSCGENLTWTLDSEGLLTISGSGEMANYYNLSHFDDLSNTFYTYYSTPWYSYADSVQRVFIETGVTKIGQNAFANCRYMTEIDLGQSVITIGDSAFAYCDSLAEIILPDSVTTVEPNVFYGCSTLTHAYFGKGVTSFLDSFAWCRNLTEITVDPDNTAYASVNGVLFSKDETKLVIYPIGKTGAYEIPDGVTEILEGAFFGCAGITGVVLPEGLTAIGEMVFDQCGNLTSITLPGSITTIGNSAFYLCDSLTDVYYNGTAEQWNEITIGEYGNEPLTGAAIHYLDDPVGPDIIDSGSCGENLTWTLYTEGLLTISGTGEMTNYENLTDYDEQSNTYSSSYSTPWYDYADSILRVSIEDGVTSIGEFAFGNCRQMTEIDIAQSVTSVEKFAFVYCENLAEIILPDSVTIVKSNAFYGCSGLTHAHIGKGVTSFLDSFANCRNLTEITVDPDNTSYASVNGVLFSRDETKLILCPEGKTGDYEVPDGVTEIQSRAFIGCAGITGVVLPEGLTAIGDMVFNQCGNLVSITLPGSLTTIGNHAFFLCDSLTDVYYHGTEEQWNEITIGESGNEALTGAEIHYIDPGIIASGSCGENLTWTLDSEGLLIICGTGNMENYFWGNHPWKSYNASIREVIVNDGVTYIGSDAFRYCSGLTSVSLPAGITGISGSAFRQCTSLTEIYIPDGVTILGSYCFNGCSSLTGIRIPLSLNEVVFDAFDGCNALTDVYYAGSRGKFNKIKIGENNSPFWSATKHYYYEVPGVVAQGNCGNNLDWMLNNEGLLTISGTGAMPNYSDESYFDEQSGTYYSHYSTPWYGYRDSIQKVSIEDGVTTIGQYAFANCGRMTETDLGQSVVTIGDSAFFSCGSLAEIILPDSVKTVETNVFYGCSMLTHAHLGKRVSTFLDSFGWCRNLTEITVDPANTAYASVDGVLFSKDMTKLVLCPEGKTGAYEIPDGVTEILGGAFFGCDRITSVVLPEGLTAIGNMAFDQCRNLVSITVPGSVTTIGDSAFFLCDSLTDVYYKGTVEQWGEITIGEYDNEPLAGATIHCSDGLLGPDIIASGSCGENLLWALYTEGLLKISGTGAMQEMGFGTAPWHDYADRVQCVVLEDGVSNISGYAFLNCSNLLEVSIADSVDAVGEYAFLFCSSLTEVVIPDSVLEIGYGAFRDGDKLESVTFSENLTGIGGIAFGNCHSLKEIILPTSVTRIGEYAFTCCISLEELVLPDGLTNVENYLCSGCNELKSVVIPGSVEMIGEGAFSYCYELDKVVMENGVTSIGDYAFYECSKLANVYYGGTQQEWRRIAVGENNEPLDSAVIHWNNPVFVNILKLPDNLTVIESEAFVNLPGVEAVVIPESVTGIAEDAFDRTVYLIVPNEQWVQWAEDHGYRWMTGEPVTVTEP